MGPLKWIERLGRRLLVWVVARILRTRKRQVRLGPAPRILVVRLDERVGNLILLTPVLASLKMRFPDARVDLLGSVKGQPMIEDHPTLDTFLPFRKRALLAPDGPLRTPFRLRRLHYDLAIDAANPTDPSTTQVILVRLSGAAHTVGVDHAGFGSLFSAPASLEEAGPHEIDLRLALLGPVPGDALTRVVTLPPPPAPDPATPVGRFIAELGSTPFAVVNVGARLSSKCLQADQYAGLAAAARDTDLTPVLAYGPTPAERALAQTAGRACEASRLAPPTSLIELAALMVEARAVISCDTGPMHLAVAVGTPTCGLFVATEPERYGYAEAPHMIIDARNGIDGRHLDTVRDWLRLSSTSSPASSSSGAGRDT